MSRLLPLFTLPSIRTLARTRRTLSAARLEARDHAEALALVQASAERGDNVGRDEFPADLASFSALLGRSEALALRNVSTGRSLEALLLVTPCKPARSVAPTVCTLYVLTTPACEGRQVWADLTRLGEQWVREGLGAGPGRYSAVTQLVFVHCVERLMAAREAGLLVTACIPLAGQLSGHPGHTASYILYKDLGIEPLAYLPRVDRAPPSVPLSPPTLLDLPFLPFDGALTDGTAVRYRALTHADIDDFYAAFHAEIQSGHGYGLDELPTREFFIGRYVHEWYTIIITLASTGRAIGYANFGPSSYSRSANPVLADGNAIFVPEYRNRGLARILMGILTLGAVVSGYKGGQSEWSMDNVASGKASMVEGAVANGVLPRGIFYRDVGWVDSCLAYKNLEMVDADELMERFVNGRRKARL